MIERSIRIGETKAYRYIGVEPPIPDYRVAQIIRIIKLPGWVATGIHFRQNHDHIDKSPTYTEFWVDADHSEYGDWTINTDTIGIAQLIATVLSYQGDPVEVDEHIIPANPQTPLFGTHANKLYQAHEKMQILQNQK